MLPIAAAAPSSGISFKDEGVLICGMVGNCFARCSWLRIDDPGDGGDGPAADDDAAGAPDADGVDDVDGADDGGTGGGEHYLATRSSS